jgi:hypothetical protein
MSDKTFRRNDVVNCVDEGEDGAMLYNPDKDDTVLLNPTGRVVWGMLEAPKTLEQLADGLTQTWPELKPDQAKADTQAFLDSVVPDFVTADEG